MVFIVILFVALYALYVGGRLKQSEHKVEVLRAALDRHLLTGDDYRTAANDDGLAA